MPQIFLSPLPFAGQSHRSQAQARRYTEELSQSEVLTHVVKAAASTGTDGGLCFYNDDLLLALRQVQQQYPSWLVYPVVPNMADYSRAMNQYGMVGAGMRRVKDLGGINLVRLGLFAIPKALKVYQRNMQALLPILVGIEMMAFARLHPPAVLLHAGMTDLALANNNVALIRSFTHLVRHRYQTRPGLMTHNLGHALVWIRSEELDIEVVAAPANTKGWLMHPSQLDCEQTITDWTGRLIAIDPLCGWTLDVCEGLAYVTRHGFDAFTVEVGSQADLSLLDQVVRWVRDAEKDA